MSKEATSSALIPVGEAGGSSVEKRTCNDRRTAGRYSTEEDGMALEEHTIREPAWIKALVDDVVLEAIEPLGFIGPLGYRWWQPGDDHNTFDGWQVVVFPAPYEIRGPVPHDGSKSVSGFRLDFGRILEVLSSVESVVWHSPVQYNGDLDGPELSVRGQFAGKHVWLRFFNLPPPDEPCSHCVNPATGETWEKPAC